MKTGKISVNIGETKFTLIIPEKKKNLNGKENGKTKKSQQNQNN